LRGSWNIILGAALGYVGIFLPGLLLMSSLLPLWKAYRKQSSVKTVFKGVNAAAVGLVFAAIYVLSEKAIVSTDHSDLVSSISNYPLYTSVAAISYAMTGFMNVPAPLSIFFGGIVGILNWVARR
jgi:chromate transport protein ChrA